MTMTLWDLLAPVLPRALRPARPAGKPNRPAEGPQGRASNGAVTADVPAPPRAPTGSAGRSTVGARRGGRGKGQATSTNGRAVASTASERYERVTRLMLDRYGVRVRKWRSSMSGVAWYITYRDGSVARLIEAPKPKGPMSAAVFLHEIGHHAIGFNRFKPRCLEEYHAWAWAIEQMEAHGITVTDAVKHRMHQSLHYAVRKAVRRGLKALPVELEPFAVAPGRRRRRSAVAGGGAGEA